MTVVSAGCQVETSGFKYFATVGSEVGTGEVGDGRDVIGCPDDGGPLDLAATASVDDAIGAPAGVHALASARTTANDRRRLNAVTIAQQDQDRNEGSPSASTPSRQEARLYPVGEPQPALVANQLTSRIVSTPRRLSTVLRSEQSRLLAATFDRVMASA
jgi:hypothetical protein